MAEGQRCDLHHASLRVNMITKAHTFVTRIRQLKLAVASLFRLIMKRHQYCASALSRAYRTTQAFAQRALEDKLCKLNSVTAACINTEETLEVART
ncbi:MAG: hypothetical protein WBP93_12360 [Pyrinomonadaceae bacterium]